MWILRISVTLLSSPVLKASLWHFFSLVWKTSFSNSFKVGLLPTNSLTFLCSENVFISPWFLGEINSHPNHYYPIANATFLSGCFDWLIGWLIDFALKQFVYGVFGHRVFQIDTLGFAELLESRGLCLSLNLAGF